MGRTRDHARRRVTALLTALLALPLTFVASGAEACSVCFSSTAETRWAYYGTTALMSLVPLLFVAAIALWLRRAARAQRLAAEGAEASDVSSSGAHGSAA